MNRFIHTSRAARVVFGEHALAELPGELARLGVSRLHLIAGPRMTLPVANLFADALATTTSEFSQHVPIDEVDRAAVIDREYAVDGYVAVGGGSAIGLAKALAQRSRRPIIAAPTTYSGSEMTPIWATTDAGIKTTGTDPAVAPVTVLYDPVLVASLPSTLAVPSAANAMAHAVEALYAVDGSPLIDVIAEESLRLLGRAIPTLGGEHTDSSIEACASALQGSWLAGLCLGSVSMALHHKLCHTLGGSFGLPHAETHAVLLPYAIWFNASMAPKAAQTVARALGVDDAPAGLQSIIRRVGGPTSLTQIGFDAENIDSAIELAVQKPYPNPRRITAEALRELLLAAVAGELPTTPTAGTS